MAIIEEAKAVSLTTMRRTWRVEIFADYGSDPTIKFHREVLELDHDGVVKSRRQLVEATYSLGEISGDSITLDGKEYSGKQLASIIWAFGDKCGEQAREAHLLREKEA